MDMPFADIDNTTFLELFADFEWEETASGEWTFGQWWYLSGVGWKFEPLIERDNDQDPEQALLNDALHFGYETYDPLPYYDPAAPAQEFDDLDDQEIEQPRAEWLQRVVAQDFTVQDPDQDPVQDRLPAPLIAPLLNQLPDID